MCVCVCVFVLSGLCVYVNLYNDIIIFLVRKLVHFCDN
jgi:hypothetical protein